MVNTSETLALVKQAQTSPNEALAKSFTQATGLVAYDLQAPALKLYPVITPLRNIIPRVPGNGGTATNWRAITGININNLSVGVSEGNRGGGISTSVTSYTVSYKGIGLEDSVSFESDFAAQGFDDVKARAVEGLLRAVMIGEEKLIIGGNNSVSLGTTPTPTLAAVASGGSLSNAAYTVQCVALAFDGFMNSSVAAGVPAAITRTNTDSTTDTYGGGSAQVSATATVTPAANGTINATVATVKGAIAYAWFWGTGGTATLGAITTINSVVIAAAAQGTQTASSLPASDNSRNALVFDGLISQIAISGSNAYYNALGTGAAGTGSTLTSDGAGGIVEIDAALKSFWDNYRLSPRPHPRFQPGDAEHLQKSGRQWRRALVSLQPGKRRRRDQRRRGDRQLPQPLHDGWGRDDQGYAAPERSARHDHLLQQRDSLCVVERFQHPADQDAPRLLPARMAAARPPLRIRRLCRRGIAELFPACVRDDHQHRQRLIRRVPWPQAI